MEANRGEDHQHERSSLGFINYLNRQSEWLEKTKGNMIVAATVIASMSFQVMANPPGGVWQSDDDCPPKYPNGTIPVCKSKAGTSVLAHAGSKRRAYLAMVISSTVSFSASMSIILLAISGLRLRNRIIMGILITFMVVAVLCISAAFALSIVLVQFEDEVIVYIVIIYIVFWIVFPVLIFLIQLVLLLGRLICFICRCCQR